MALNSRQVVTHSRIVAKQKIMSFRLGRLLGALAAKEDEPGDTEFGAVADDFLQQLNRRLSLGLALALIEELGQGRSRDVVLSFIVDNAEIFAALLESDKGHNLVWSRPRKVAA